MLEKVEIKNKKEKGIWCDWPHTVTDVTHFGFQTSEGGWLSLVSHTGHSEVLLNLGYPSELVVVAIIIRKLANSTIN